MSVEQHEAVDIYNILSLYSTDAVIKRSKNTSVHSIELVYGDTSGTFEMLVTMEKNRLPHTVIVSGDDVCCSCTGFISTFKCQKLCTHLIIGIAELYTKQLLLRDEIVKYLKNWKDRNDCDGSPRN